MGYRLTPHWLHYWVHSFFKNIICLCCISAVLLSPLPADAFFEFTIEDEAKMGKQFEILVKSQMPLIQDPEITGYINGIVQKLNKAIPPQPFPFVPSVIRHNSVNAFAVPGGYIFVCTGLIVVMEHEAELAGVLAHEMAHVSQRHIASRVQQSSLISIASVLGALAGAFLGGQGGSAMVAGSMAAGQTAMLHYSRANEADADQVGFGYLIKSGFKPSGMVGAFKILGRKQWTLGGTIPSYYSTHPDINSRVKDMQAQVDFLAKDIQNRPHNDAQFLRIQTLIRARYSDPDFAAITFAKELQRKENPLSYLGQGILFARHNKIADANKSFAKALELSPNDYIISREAGYFHYTKSDKHLGLNLLNKAIRQNPKDIMALFYLARALGDQGNYGQAIEYMHRVLLSVPEDAEVHESIATLYGQNNDLFKAYLHLAYGALYSNNPKKTQQLHDRLSAMPRNPAETALFEKFSAVYKLRQSFWKG